MDRKITQDTMLRAMDMAYDYALDRLGGHETVEEFAERFLEDDNFLEVADTLEDDDILEDADTLEDDDTLEDCIASLIKWQTVKVSASGFLSGLPGLVAAPVTVPADLVSCLWVELRMASAIAYMCGLDPRSDCIRTFTFVSLCGDSATDVLEQSGIDTRERLTLERVSKIPDETLVNIKKTVGIHMMTGRVGKGMLSLHRAVPVVSAFLNAGLNAVWCSKAGDAAKYLFMTMGGYDIEEEIECPYCSEPVFVCGEGIYECEACDGEIEYMDGDIFYEDDEDEDDFNEQDWQGIWGMKK